MAANKLGSVSLQYPMLTRDNYASWCIKMKVFMQAQGVWDAVEPAAGVAVETKKDKMALAAIYQGIPEDVLLVIAEKQTAKDAWNTLKTMYLGAVRVRNAKVQTLKSEFDVLRMKETDSVDEFAMKISSITSKVRGLGETMEENYIVKKFLRSMPEKFLPIVSTIEQFGDIEVMSFEEAIGRLKTHEEKLHLHHMQGGHMQGENEQGRLLLTYAEWQARAGKTGGGESSVTHDDGAPSERGGRGGWGGRQEGEGRGSKPKRDKSNIRCFNCDVYGHFASECRKPKRNHEDQVNLMCAQDDEPTLL